MIRNSSTVLLLIAAMITALSPSVAEASSLKRCAAPSKSDFEKILGKPVKCPSAFRESVCFDRGGTSIRIHFNSSAAAESIDIFTNCVGLWSLEKIANEIVPESNRGKVLKRIEKSKPGDCATTYLEEYKCLTMEYGQRNCMNCTPASIKIVWIK